MDDWEAVLAVRGVAEGQVETAPATCDLPAVPAVARGCTTAVQSMLADLPLSAASRCNDTTVNLAVPTEVVSLAATPDDRPGAPGVAPGVADIEGGATVTLAAALVGGGRTAPHSVDASC